MSRLMRPADRNAEPDRESCGEHGLHRPKEASTIANRPQLIVTTSAGSGDSTPPTVTSKTPAIGATGVPIGQHVSAVFSEAVNGVGTSSFVLTPQAGGAALGSVPTFGFRGELHDSMAGRSISAACFYTPPPPASRRSSSVRSMRMPCGNCPVGGGSSSSVTSSSARIADSRSMAWSS